MKIGFFSDSYFPEVDGVTYTLNSWKEELRERGHEVFIIYPDSSQYEPKENEIPIKSVSNPFYEGYNIPVPLFHEDYPDLDIVHCHSPAFIGISGLRYSQKKDIPAVYTHHTPLEEYFEQSVKSGFLADQLSKAYVPFESALLARFDALTSSTSEPRRPVEFEKLPVGVDMEFFQPSENDFFENMELERPIAGYSGRLSLEKNPCELLEMAEEFEGTLVIVGEGPLREKIEENKKDNVVVMDFLDREKLPEFYSSIDVFVTASTGDTLGLSTLEANACGTPVVAPNVVPFNRTIGDDSGELYQKGDIEDFTSRINSVIDSDYDTRKAVDQYALKKTVEKLENIYTELEQE